MRGFSLIEVIVALVVLEVGLLGAVGITWIAAGIMGRAWAMEVGVASMEGVADSLSLGAVPGTGMKPLAQGRLQWEVAPDGLFEIRFVTGQGDSLAVHGLAPVVSGE